MIGYSGKIIGFSNNRVAGYGSGPVPPGPSSLPSDMHFVYLANDFANGSIPNRASNSMVGGYTGTGTLTKNGSGSNCYLSNGNDDHSFLSVDLSYADLELMKGVSNVYTFYCRVMQTSQSGMGHVGGIFSWRFDGGYVYMIRSEDNLLQIHWWSGQNTLPLDIDTVYKITVNGDIFTVTNMLNPSSTWTGDARLHGTREMGNTMTTFNAWYEGSGEAYLDRMYALAGIARATTAAEDTAITTAMMNQAV